MNIEIKEGHFVNVVATVNKAESKAEICYVSPSKVSTSIEIDPSQTNLSFRVEDDDGNYLSEYPCLVVACS